MTTDRDRSARQLGLLAFVLLTFGLIWASASVLYADPLDGTSPATIVLQASLVYVLAVGWQPLVALLIVRRMVDPWPSGYAHRPTSFRYVTLAIVLPIVVLAAAAIVKAALGPHDAARVDVPVEASAGDAVLAFASFVTAVAVLWMQSVVEEITWRGYALPRMMQLLGPWRGLVVHGLAWGACYAAIFLAGRAMDPGHAASVVITCGLLGILLGWLRLASGSVAPSAACNATLTVCAGLPQVLQGLDPAFGAVFEPAGWLPLLMLVVLVVTTPALRAVVVLRQPLASGDGS